MKSEVKDFPIPKDATDYEDTMAYARMKQMTYYPHDRRPTVGSRLCLPSKDALQHDWPNLRDCTKAGDPEARLELAVRFLSSFCLKGTMSRQEQLEWAATLLSAIARPEDPEYIEEIDTLTRAKAWSCMAMVCLEEVKHPRTTIRDLQGGLFQAANYADGSVRCGLVSEAVLRTCERIQDFDYRLRYDPPFKSFIALWAVWDKVRIIRAREAERQQRDKASKAPNAYICAAPGCGIEATKKVAFKACGGPCPLNTKPHYCSKECQVKDWPSHRPICKPGSQAPRPKTSPGDVEKMVEVINIENRLATSVGPGISVKVPLPRGELIVKSKTLPPEFLRQVRGIITSDRRYQGAMPSP